MVNQALIGGVRYDVVTATQYYNSPPNTYNPSKVCVINGEYLLPVRQGTFNSASAPGLYVNTGSAFCPAVRPTTPEDQQLYSAGNMVNYEDVSNIGELLAANAEIAEMERRFLTEPDNIFRPVIDENLDEPLLIGLKQALATKRIDLGSPYYKERMGDNYNNNCRLIKGGKNNISYGKTVEFCEATDIEMVVTFRNKSGNIPNPMTAPITVICTSGGGSNV